MFKKENAVTINKLFSNGHITNKGSLGFALSSLKSKGSLEQLAFIIRSIIVDHVFEDGNKRTATAIIVAYYTGFEVGFDEQKIRKLVLDVSSKNISNIPKIKRMIKNVIR